MSRIWPLFKRAGLHYIDFRDHRLATKTVATNYGVKIPKTSEGRDELGLTSQLPVAKWHAQIGDPTVADSILDRLVHAAHRLELHGDSIQKLRGRPGGAPETKTAPEPE